MRKAETIRCDGDWRCRVGCAWPTMTSVGGRSLPPVPPCDCDWTVAFLHYSFTERERESLPKRCACEEEYGGDRRLPGQALPDTPLPIMLWLSSRATRATVSRGCYEATRVFWMASSSVTVQGRNTPRVYATKASAIGVLTVRNAVTVNWVDSCVSMRGEKTLTLSTVY
jgi:hypothetical protein